MANGLGRNAQDLTGRRFGRLTAVRPTVKNSQRGQKWEWLCDCGALTEAVASMVKNGHTRSCGCLQREVSAEIGSRVNRTHGEGGRTRTPEYKVWCGIKRRCFNENDDSYRYYGGRGVTMCSEWRDSYDAFLRDMGRRPSQQHQIDRENVNGNYEPGNCRWVTRKEQANNKRGLKKISAHGETMTIGQWAERIGVDYRLIHLRLKRGWSPERAVLEDIHR